MEIAILSAGLFLCLTTLWLLGRRDWLRLTRPRRRVTASVTGHRVSRDDALPIRRSTPSLTRAAITR